jgi:hypothetical protein
VLFYFPSGWFQPPGWMKFNGTMLGGSMRNHYFPVYAKYYLKFLQGYAAEGVPVQALTSQNEVDTDQDGRMPACIWPQEHEIQAWRETEGWGTRSIKPVRRKPLAGAADAGCYGNSIDFCLRSLARLGLRPKRYY